MITVGKYCWYSKGTGQRLKNPNSQLHTMMLLSKSYDVDLFLFSRGGVDFEKKQIRGLFMENGKQVYKTVPIPPLIDNALEYVNPFVKQFEAHSRLVQPFRNPGKLKVYTTLKKDGRYADWLIPSDEVSGFADVRAALEKFNSRVIIKSVRSSGGRSVYSITRCSETEYEIHKGHAVEALTEDAAQKFLNDVLIENTYIAQPYICSQTNYGEPSDLRIRCRRAAGGDFKIDIVPRIGSFKGIVSNVRSGGYTIPSQAFFMREFGANWKEEHQKLITFGEDFANYYQGLFNKSVTSNVGIDIGFQRENGILKYYIFEVNAYTGASTLCPADIIHQFEYYHYLWNQHKLGGNA